MSSNYAHYSYYKKMIAIKYACLEMPSISSKEQLVELLKVYAKQILEMAEVQQDCPFYHFQDFVAGQNWEEDLRATVDELMKYIKIEDITSQGTSVIVEANYDKEADDCELCEGISMFLFSKTSCPYFLMRSAAADRAGAYSHQWIGYWKEGEVVLDDTESYFDQLFTSNVDHHPQLGISTPPVGLA